MMATPAQFDLFATVPPPFRVSRLNSSGVLEPIEKLIVKNKTYRHAEIRIAFDGDEFHWGVALSITDGGFGFAPAPKWKRTAPTRDQAILDAADYLRAHLDEKQHHADKFVRDIRRWLDEILFAESIELEPWEVAA